MFTPSANSATSFAPITMHSTYHNTRTRRPPRTRSCVPCIQAKRRCDPGLLACQRCTKQKLECRYLSYPDPTETSSQTGALATAQEHIIPAETASLTLSSDDLNLFDGFFLPNGSCDILPTLENPSLAMTGIDQPSLPHPVPATNCSFELPTFVGSRLNYGIGELKMAPSRMVLENQTPWSHPLLFEEKMPASMQGEQKLVTRRFSGRHTEMIGQMLSVLALSTWPEIKPIPALCFATLNCAPKGYFLVLIMALR